MEALQYIYTSWKNGNSTEKGYMIYSRSEGITESECTAIKDAMQYLPPKELPLAPTAEQITDIFPYAFAYFRLPTGRACVAQSTYLGRDYSGRFGNYIIYALVFEAEALPCRPAELFGEDCIKTCMTEEELNASSPVPPLPPLPVEDYASVINDDQLNEFLFDKEDEFAQLIALVLAARDAGCPFYLNDSRENLVLWASALHRILPRKLALKFAFNTYIGDHEAMRSARIREEGLDFGLIGVRPDANYFNYATECRSSRHIVMDFQGGNMTGGISPNTYAQAMASSAAMDFSEIDEFGQFLEQTSFDQISGKLQDAYLYYRLLKHDELELTEAAVKAVLRFGGTYCSEADNSDVGSKLLVKLQENGTVLAPELFAEFWCFVCRYSGFMIYTLYELLRETLYQHSGEAAGPCTELDALLDRLQAQTPQNYSEYLSYANSADAVEQMLLYLTGHDNLHTNSFYVRWIMRSYTFTEGLRGRQPIEKLLRALLANIRKLPNSEQCAMEILLAASTGRMLFEPVYQALVGSNADAGRLDRMCQIYPALVEQIPERDSRRFEKLLLETPAVASFASRLYARKISASKKPEEEFWDFYSRQKTVSGDMPLEPMIMACLKNLDADDRENAAVKMVMDLEPDQFRDPAVIVYLTDVINGCGYKTLKKADRTLLERVVRLRTKATEEGADKIRAMLVGAIVEDLAQQRGRSIKLSEELPKLNITLKSLDKSDYEAYSKDYLKVFQSMLQGAEDVAVVMGAFYHPRYFGDLVADYLSAMKKLEKKETSRWIRMVSWTCAYVIGASHQDRAAEAMYQPLVKYMKSVDQTELYDIKPMISRETSVDLCDRFFEEVNRKEGLQEKLGGLFRRK